MAVLRRLLRFLAAFAATAVVAVVWMNVAHFAFFPQGGGEFHWVLHLPRSQQVTGVYVFAATQTLAATVFTMLACCGDRIPSWAVAAGVLVPVVGFNGFQHPLLGLFSVLTAVPCVALAFGIRHAVRRWPPRVPWLLVVLPTLVWIARNDDFARFFPADIVYGALSLAMLGAVLSSGLAVLVIRRALPASAPQASPPLPTKAEA